MQQAQGAGTVPVLQTRIRTGFLTRHDRILGEFFLFIRIYGAAGTRSWHRTSSPDTHGISDEARFMSRRVFSYHQNV